MEGIREETRERGWNPRLTDSDNMVYDGSMEFITRNEVARYLRVHPRTVERWLRSGLLKGYKLGSGKTAMWRIPRNELNKFLGTHIPKNKHGGR